jgi:hypothetical protein
MLNGNEPGSISMPIEHRESIVSSSPSLLSVRQNARSIEVDLPTGFCSALPNWILKDFIDRPNLY